MVRIKICGITRPEDALAAGQYGADAVGLVFYGGSPRVIKLQQARAILEAVGPFVTPVGLFVNENPNRILQVCRRLGISVVQLHGEETFRHVQKLTDKGLTIIKAWPIASPDDCIDLHRFDQNFGSTVAAYLLDSRSPTARGGTGEVFDWGLLKDIHLSRPIILAGGLTPENVADAIVAVAPYGVDVSSGVEQSAGIKDPQRIRQFIERASAIKGQHDQTG